MNEEIKVIVIGGAGEMGRQCIKAATEHGATVVAATGRSQHLGEDLGLLSGMSTPLGVRLSPATELPALLDSFKPDVAIMCSLDFRGTADDMRTIIKAGVNVLTLAEEAYYPRIDEPGLTAEIDALAKQYGVSVVGNGMQDVNWSNQAVVMSGNCRELTQIYGENWCILDHCGPQEFEGLGIGCKSAEEFAEYHRNNPRPRSPFSYSLYEIAEELGLEVIEEINDVVQPIFASEPYFGCGSNYHPGDVIGSILCTTLKTSADINIVGRFVYSFAVNGEGGVNIWRFTGDPSFEVVTNDPRPDISTTAGAVNRIPDCINARPGFLLVKDLAKPCYKAKPLHEYVI
jgi:4-hydroxy-tetrahydrodipicolinate reductase